MVHFSKIMNSWRGAVKQEESLSCKEPMAPVKGKVLECRRPVGKVLLKSKQDPRGAWAETGHDLARLPFGCLTQQGMESQQQINFGQTHVAQNPKIQASGLSHPKLSPVVPS